MNKIKELRKAKNWSQSILADKLNTSQVNISGWESGKYQPDIDTLLKMSDVFEVSLDYLLGNNALYSNKTVTSNVVKIPIFGAIPAGIPTEMIDEGYIEDYEEIDADMLLGGREYFGLRVKGESMLPEFRPNDILIMQIMQKIDDCNSGDCCAVSINCTENTFKKIIKKENGIVLQPLNAQFEPCFYSDREIESLPIKIIGKVVEIRRKI